MLIFIDTETTGLDPQLDWPLEIAMLLVTDDLLIVASYTEIIRPSWGMKSNRKAMHYFHPEAWEMHQDSGLIKELQSGRGKSAREVDEEACAWIERHQAHGLPTAGSSVHFDLEVVRSWLPMLHKQFHYRQVNVSSLRELARRWRPEIMLEDSSKVKAHRAMPDVQASLVELTHYRAELFCLDRLHDY